MHIVGVIRQILIAAIIAASCECPGLAGVFNSVILLWAATAFAIVLLPRFPTEPTVAGTDQPVLQGFLPWFVATGCFVFFALVFAPVADFPAISIGFLLLSPVFGVMALTIDSALAAIRWRPAKGTRQY